MVVWSHIHLTSNSSKSSKAWETWPMDFWSVYRTQHEFSPVKQASKVYQKAIGAPITAMPLLCHKHIFPDREVL